MRGLTQAERAVLAMPAGEYCDDDEWQVRLVLASQGRCDRFMGVIDGVLCDICRCNAMGELALRVCIPEE